MGLTLRKTSDWWYARYYIDGKQIVKRLEEKVVGVRPDKLSEDGDRTFERSRTRAETKFEALEASMRSDKSETQLAEAVYQARAGSKLKKHPLADMPTIWIEKPRKRKPSFAHRENCTSQLKRLITFVEDQYPNIRRVDQLRQEHVVAFLDALERDGVTAETWNKYLVVIKTVLKRVGVPAAADIISREVETIFREPFSIEELHAVFEAAKADPLIYKLVVVAATTAMRRKDCCFLRWDSIDLDEAFITVKTSKTGVVVDIPMADLLVDVVKAEQGNGSEYVFPNAVELYAADPTAITRRFKTILRRAGFDDGKGAVVEFKTDAYTAEELQTKAGELYAGKKLIHVLAVIGAYTSGQSMKASAEAAGVGISSASLYLNELEAATGKAIIRGKPRAVEGVAKPSRGSIRQERKTGKLAASVRGFHSFRTTWVTLALTNGMPIETVKKVTGHQTADIVTKHYFKPHRAELRKAIQKGLPQLLTGGGTESPTERAIDVLRGNGGMQKRIDEALKILEAGQ